MGYNRPGRSVPAVNNSGGAINHLAPFLYNGFAGQAIKQVAADPTVGLVNPPTIANTEKFVLITKGVVQVSTTGITSPAVGDPVYITTANALTKTVGTNAKFGRITEIAGQRGTPTAQCRIDLDTKDSF